MTSSARTRIVQRSTGGSADEEAYWPCRIGLCSCDLRKSRKRGCARGEMQEFAAGKFDGAPPRVVLPGQPTMRRTYRESL